MSTVLILNSTYEPHLIVDRRKAINLLIKDRAELVKEIPGSNLRSFNFSMPTPSVIRLFRYIKYHRKAVPCIRKNVVLRDKKCGYCGMINAKLTVDHIVPTSRGGQNDWLNVVACCVKCNSKKGNKTLNEANMKLLITPRRPSPLLFIRYAKIRSDWEEFLFLK